MTLTLLDSVTSQKHVIDHFMAFSGWSTTLFSFPLNTGSSLRMSLALSVNAGIPQSLVLPLLLIFTYMDSSYDLTYSQSFEKPLFAKNFQV